ncbi:Na+/H+ antiporter subunit E [Aquabacterium soli]|jgi:multicomponent K+:H+ antiporter subunit E|nr:Na+/H+ antiporter subunit E [Aquabacterium soli]
MMLVKRLFPAPLLSIALAALWLVLNRSYTPGDWLLAIVLGLAAPALTRSLRPTPVVFRKPWVAIKLFFTVGSDVIGSNVRVLRGTLASGEKLPTGTFIVVPLDLHDPNGLAVLAAIMCVIPGTIWSEMALDRSALLVHVFDLEDEKAEIAMIKSRYERPLIEIFQAGRSTP